MLNRDLIELLMQFPLDADVNKTGDYWPEIGDQIVIDVAVSYNAETNEILIGDGC